MLIDPSVMVECTVRRTIPAAVTRVFQAWIDPAFARRWSWGQGYVTTAIEIDCRVGGVWKQSIFHREKNETWHFDGVFQEVVPNTKLVHTFHWTSDHGAEEEVSLVTIHFHDRGDSTEVVIRHTRLDPNKKSATEGGWIEVLENVEHAVLDPEWQKA